MNCPSLSFVAAHAMLAPAFFLTVLLGGCDDGGGDPASQEGTTRVYTVRGEVRSLPDAEAVPPTDLMIRHEAIPNFVNPGGDRGMASMTMPFPVFEGVDTLGLAVGDKVEFVLETNYDAPWKYRVTQITPLPARAILDFSETFDPADHASPHEH